MEKYDLIILGGGPAGYVAGIRATQHGKRVLCVEKELLGGTCLNWGCIPTKSLLKNAQMYDFINNEAKNFGIEVSDVKFDFQKIIQRSRNVSSRLNKGIEFLFRKNKIDKVEGTASFNSADEITVTKKDGSKEVFSSEKILVSTGVVPRELPGFSFSEENVLSSKKALILDKKPEELVILGAGAIGVEFAYFFACLGTKVTLLEAKKNILPLEDTEVTSLLEKVFKKKGIEVLTSTKAERSQENPNEIILKNADSDEELKRIPFSSVLVAVGVQSNLPKGLDFELENNFLKVNSNYETSIPNVYGAGDIIGPPLLAHVASFEAIQAVNGMFGINKPKKAVFFPSCTYCIPQVASVGQTEDVLKEEGISYKSSIFPFQANGKALAIGAPEGFVKILFDAKHGGVLGAHIIGEEATELIGELNLAINMEATYEDIASTIHAHPTLGEAIAESSEGYLGHAIHI